MRNDAETFIHLWTKFTGGIEYPLEAQKVASFLSVLGPPYGLAAMDDRLVLQFLLHLHVPLHWSVTAEGRVLAVPFIKLFKYLAAVRTGLEIQETSNNDETMMVALRHTGRLRAKLTRQVCRGGQSSISEASDTGTVSMRALVIAFLPMLVLKRIPFVLSWTERDPAHTSSPNLFSTYVAASVVQAGFRMRRKAVGTASVRGSLLPYLVDNHVMARTARKNRAYSEQDLDGRARQ
jgi:hypothetical protein